MLVFLAKFLKNNTFCEFTSVMLDISRLHVTKKVICRENGREIRDKLNMYFLVVSIKAFFLQIHEQNSTLFRNNKNDSS